MQLLDLVHIFLGMLGVALIMASVPTVLIYAFFAGVVGMRSMVWPAVGMAFLLGCGLALVRYG